MQYQNAADETLVMLTLAGEQAAYEVLVTRYQRTVISAAVTVTKTRFMAEDAAQDAFVTAWMKLDTLQEPSKYASWVCRIAKNCAVNMMNRYRSFLPLDLSETVELSDDGAGNPEELTVRNEERNEVGRAVGSLPEKVGTIIRLHYFDDLSVAEIADRMRISEGTVKRQLHDGRKRIRKELCAMDEKYSDTLVRRVMKKVEELKLWQVRNDKTGFETVYNEVLKEVEALPECTEKQRALADVLMRGWWWLPGGKNDALFARIRDAAEASRNEEVMSFIVTREDSQLYGDARIDFIRDKQIPRLEKAGFVKTLGREWFWLGINLFLDGKPEEGKAAFDRVEAVLSKEDVFRVLVPYARRMEEILAKRHREKEQERYRIGGTTEEYRKIDGNFCYWSEEGFREGFLGSVDRYLSAVFRNACLCDGRFFADIRVGEKITGSDGTTLTYLSDSGTAETPAGTFADCQVWEVRHRNDMEKRVCRTYYRDGVGIVRQELTTDGVTTALLLSNYEIKGGDGMLPMFPGNMWEYETDYAPDVLSSELQITVSHADAERVLISVWEYTERLGYDKTSWAEAVQEIASEYVHDTENGEEYLCDVTEAAERAERLAKTPMEKAHSKAAVSVVKRILDTNPAFHPGCTATGHWNFFNRSYLRKKGDTLTETYYNCRWSFEWKNTGNIDTAGTPLLYNDILGILQDAANCVWSDEWRVGASPTVEYTEFESRTIKTQCTCEDGGTVTTKAGTFENCLKLRMDISGMTDGASYRGGNKTYYFAPGIGIVRTENEYCGGARTAVYELSSYIGTGEGYMPVSDGLVRRYDALNLTDGFVGAVEYTYAADEDGDIVVFSDQTGIRVLPPPITQYSAIQDEIIEDRLWDEGKHDESRHVHDLNNFRLLCHFFGRPSRYWAAPEKGVAWNKYRLRVMEGLGDGTVPAAWLGHYASTSFRTACALFGCGKKDEGYDWLEKAFEAFPKWDAIPDGTEMETGDPLIWGGIKVVKGDSVLRLPDGTKEVLTYSHLFEGDCGLLYYGMTAPHGWEWFDSVRNEERYKEYVERAKAMTQKE